MLHNLYDYVEKTLKVILIFETYSYTRCKEFLIYGNLGKSELDNFLRTCSTESTSCSSLCEIKKELRSKYPTIEPRRRIIADKEWRDTFLQPVFALKKAEYKCFYEVIEQNNDIPFVTLNVPLSKSLFMKIVDLKDIYAEYYTNCEMYMILKYVFPFKYRIKWMTSVACTHFNKNSALVNKLRQYSEDPEKYEFNYQTTFLSNILFGTDDIALNFRNAVNSYISFSLVGINDQRVSTTRKVDTNKIIKVINLHELSIEFLFDNIYLNYSCLEQNDDVLNDKFNKHVHKRLLIVEIYDEETNINNVDANRNLYNNMSIVQKSKFLIGKNVGEIILNINEMPREINTSIFSYMNVVTIVRCRLHPNDFISTFPSHVQVILELYNVGINDEILPSHPNIIELVFVDCEFESDILFLSDLKSVKLLRSTTIDGVILTFNRNIQRIMIENSKGQFNLSGIGGFNRIDIKKKNKTFFKYEKKGEILLLNMLDVHIYGTIYVDQDIDDVIFEKLTVQTGSKIVLNEKIKGIIIRECTGMFDLRTYLGFECCLKKSAYIKIALDAYSMPNIYHIILHHIHLEQSLVLPGNCRAVVLREISTAERALIILNESCEVILILMSDLRIDAKNVEIIKGLHLRFSVSKPANIRLINPRDVNYLLLENICRNSEVIEPLLTSFREIHHLKFRSCYTGKEMNTFKKCIGNTYSSLLLGECSNDFLNFLRKYFAS